MTDWFAEYFTQISVFSALIFMAAHAAVHWETVPNRVGEMAAVGGFGLGLPLGVLLILLPFFPEMSQKIVFPPFSAVLGFIYTVYGIAQIRQKLRK